MQGYLKIQKNMLHYFIALYFMAGIFTLPLNAGQSAGETDPEFLPVTFDFGTGAENRIYGVLSVNADMHYSKAHGYGLISTEQTNYVKSEESARREPLYLDGISSDGAIEFRVDVPPGEYWIELFMDGGRFNIWRGDIRINNQQLLDSLTAYTTSFEGEDPPVYWTFLKRISLKNDHILLSVKANKQPVTLACLRIFPQRDNNLSLSGAKVSPNIPLQSPNAALALRLINAGEIKEAQRIIDPVPEEDFPLEKAYLLMALAGRLEVENPRPFLVWASMLLNQVKDPQEKQQALIHQRLLDLYLEADQWNKMAGWDWARQKTGAGIFNRLDLSGFAYQKISEIRDHPLSNQALFQLGKLCFWSWVEQHDKGAKKKATSSFSELLTFYPDHGLLRLYAGENRILPEPESLDSPPWAYYASRALAQTLRTIHYWVDIRQADNGEFGGKYDDDVEMLRWWPIGRLAVDDQITLTGLRRLVDGIWNSDWIYKGYSAKVRDVEHAAEPVADTQPMMIGLDYGNPIYVERCMESVKGLRDLWTGINARGHRHFKSSWYSSTAIDIRPPRDCDLQMNARTVKAARWLAWYNRHPFVMQFLREWADAWLEDCLRTDKGKPKGIVPAAIRYEDDAIGGHSDNWYAPGMFWHYFDFNGGTQMLHQLLATYDLTGDTRYLQPIELAIELVKKFDGKTFDKTEPGSEEWVVDILRRSDNFAETIEKYRLLTGIKTYDNLVSRYGSDYLKFRLQGEVTDIEKGCRQVLEGLINNGELITSEGYFTDRIEIGNIHQNQIWGASHLESCYTGISLSEGFYPFYAVSWKGFNERFAALVTEATKKELVIWVHNLEKEEQKGELYLWRLEPGSYRFEQGNDKNNDGEIDRISLQEDLKIISKPGVMPISLAGHSTQIIRIIQKQSRQNNYDSALADLAFHASEISLNFNNNNLDITIPLHNIGIKEATAFDVRLSENYGDQAVPIAHAHINRIEAPLDLEPSRHSVHFTIEDYHKVRGSLIITADPDNKVREITEINNQVIVSQEDLRP